jgi:hypothetical protein
MTEALGELSAALPKAVQPFIHVEVCQKSCSTARASVVGQHATRFLSRMGTTYGDAVLKEFDDPLLKEHVDSISLSEAEPASSDRRVVFLCVHVLI